MKLVPVQIENLVSLSLKQGLLGWQQNEINYFVDFLKGIFLSNRISIAVHFWSLNYGFLFLPEFWFKIFKYCFVDNINAQ